MTGSDVAVLVTIRRMRRDIAELEVLRERRKLEEAEAATRRALDALAAAQARRDVHAADLRPATGFYVGLDLKRRRERLDTAVKVVVEKTRTVQGRRRQERAARTIFDERLRVFAGRERDFERIGIVAKEFAEEAAARDEAAADLLIEDMVAMRHAAARRAGSM